MLNLKMLMEIKEMNKEMIKKEVEKSLNILFETLPKAFELEKEIMEKANNPLISGLIISKGRNSIVDKLCSRENYFLKKLGIDANFERFFTHNLETKIKKNRTGEEYEIKTISYTNIADEKNYKDFIDITFRNTCWKIDSIKNLIEETNKSFKIKGSHYCDIFKNETKYKIESTIADILNIKGIEYNNIVAKDGMIEIDGEVLCSYKVQKNGTLILNK